MTDIEHIRAAVAAEQIGIAVELLQKAQHSLAVTVGGQRAADAALEALQHARIAAARTAIVLRALTRR